LAKDTDNRTNPTRLKYNGVEKMNGVKAYTDSSIITQNKGRLIVILYEGAIKFMKLAIRELEAGNHQAKGEYINKAINIFNELSFICL
jgi:flagellar protein FliS